MKTLFWRYFCFNLLSILQVLVDKTNLHSQLGKKQQKEEDKQSEGTLLCVKCNKRFGNKRTLTRHMDIQHAGRFKFYCDQCKQGFSDSTHYKYHMNKHAGIMYRCSMCTKSFNSEEGRGLHMSVHTGVYRFTCNVCSQGFNQKNRYDKHCNEH